MVYVSSTGAIPELLHGTKIKVEDKFIDTFIAKEGETIEEANARIQAEDSHLT